MYKLLAFIVCCVGLNACNYSFKGISIPSEVKTIKINFIENRARYVNPQFGPQLTDKLRQKITNQTRLLQVQGDDAHYEVSGVITSYDLSTSGVSNQQASTNRLMVNVHIVFVNHLDPTGRTVSPKNFEADISKPFEFSASLSLQQAEAQLQPDILRDITDLIFNKLFSTW